MRHRRRIAAAWLCAVAATLAQAQFVTPNENLTVDGIPPIPREIAEKVNEIGRASCRERV